jgi:hypothetical protein
MYIVRIDMEDAVDQSRLKNVSSSISQKTSHIGAPDQNGCRGLESYWPLICPAPDKAELNIVQCKTVFHSACLFPKVAFVPVDKMFHVEHRCRNRLLVVAPARYGLLGSSFYIECPS